MSEAPKPASTATAAHAATPATAATTADNQQQQQSKAAQQQQKQEKAPARRIRIETIAKSIASEWKSNKNNHNRNKSNPLEGASWLCGVVHHAAIQAIRNGFEVVFEFEGNFFNIDHSGIWDAYPVKDPLVPTHSYNVFTSAALKKVTQDTVATLDSTILDFSKKDRADDKDALVVVPGNTRLSTESFNCRASEVFSANLKGKKTALNAKVRDFFQFYCQPNIAQISKRTPLEKIKEDLLKEKCPKELATETVESIEFCRKNAGTTKSVQGLYESRFKFQEEVVKSFDDEKKLSAMVIKE